MLNNLIYAHLTGIMLLSAESVSFHLFCHYKDPIIYETNLLGATLTKPSLVPSR